MANHTRRQFLKNLTHTAISMGPLAILPGCANINRLFALKPKRPNIIFIMADDHDSNAMSCYGSKINKTPNLDRIANEGMRFDNCFCTNSICAPSRAVILTGKYSHLNGVIDNMVEVDGSQQTFPKLLQTAGYETAMVGKWHLKSMPTGFDYWNILPGHGNYHDPTFIEMGRTKKHTGYVTDLITDFTLDWLRNRTSDKPFCLMYHHKAPHRNWQPDDKHAKMYENVEIPYPLTFNDDYGNYKTRSDAARQQEMTIAHHLSPKDLKVPPPENWSRSREEWDSLGYKGEPWSPPGKDLKGQALKRWKFQRYIKDYLRCVASIDDNVGRLLDWLEDTGLAANTIVIYTSDQGFYLGDHGWFDKRFMYEQSLRMPFIVRFPGAIKAGSVNTDITLNLDFAPTFLDWAGAHRPPDMQGKSLKPLMQGKTPSDWRTSMYYPYYEYPGWHAVKRHYGVRTQRYKLIHFYYDIDAWELYDLQNDPYELKNIYNDPAYSGIVKQLKTELKHLRKKYGDSDELTAGFLPKH